MKYRKKPVVIEAYMFAGGKQEPGFPAGWITCQYSISDDGEFLSIQTLEGIMKADKGDFIIKGVNGEFYPCKPDIFEKTYEAVKI
jgi:hypothetical protein